MSGYSDGFRRGINVAWDKPKLPGILRFMKAWRWVLAALVLWNVAMCGVNIAAGSAFAAVSAVCALALGATFVWQTRIIRTRTAELRPRPDYSLIASMERPIWGQAFEHAGAPAQPKQHEPEGEQR